MEPTKVIATYARVSTANQEEEQTILTQVEALRDFAHKQGHQIVQEYADEGWSGDVLIRPALDRLRQDAKQKIWNAVLVYDPDRLARRYSYQELIMDELREAGIEVIFVTVSAPKNSEDKILHGVRGLFAEYERAKIAERFRLGKLRKVKEGNILTTVPLYGYTYVPKEEKRHGYYTINESEASVVRMIFGWVAEEGLTQRKIVRRLQDMDIKPRKSKRGVWNTSTLSTLLSHRGYIGEAHWGKSYAVVPENPIKLEHYRKTRKTSRRDRPKDEWYKIPIPPIIDEQLFNKARETITSNFELCQRNRKNEYLLAGRIFCVCGRRRAGEGPQQGKHLYYRCNSRVASFPLSPDCTEKGVNARAADKIVWQQIVALMVSPELMLRQAGRNIAKNAVKADYETGRAEALRGDLRKLQEQEDRYNRAFGAGVFSLEQLKGYLVPIREKITSVRNQLARIRPHTEKVGDSVPPDLAILKDFAKAATETLANLSFEAKRGIVLKVIEKVVSTNRQLSFQGCIPISPDVELFTDYRYRQESISNTAARIEIPFKYKLDIPDYHKFYGIPPKLRRDKRGRFVRRPPQTR